MWRTLAMRITSYDVQKVPDSRLLWRSQIRTPYTPNTIYSHTLLICVKTYAWKASSWKVIWRSYILTPYTPTTIFSHPTHPILYSHTLHTQYYILTPWCVRGRTCRRRPVGKTYGGVIFSHPTHIILYSLTLLITYVPKAPRRKALWWSHIVTPHTSATLFSHRTDLCPYTSAEGAQLESTSCCIWSAIQS